MSQDATNRRFEPITAFDVSDENPEFLARRLDALQREVRDGFALVMAALERISKTLEGDHMRDSDIEQRVVALEQPKRKAIKK